MEKESTYTVGNIKLTKSEKSEVPMVFIGEHEITDAITFYKVADENKRLRLENNKFEKSIKELSTFFNTRKDKERQIINHYGVIPQLKYMQTEMFEFIEAIIEREIHWNFDTEIQDIRPLDKHIEEEYADLTMMLEQFKEYYHLDEDNIQRIKEQKIERQLKRIEEEK